MKYTLDGHEVMAIADTGSDLNFIRPKCANREEFHINKSDTTHIPVQLGDGTLVETIGQVQILHLSLDWRKPVTEKPRMTLEELSTEGKEQPASFETIFHVLPGLPCDVILGRDILDKTDAFNRCHDPSCTRVTSNRKAFELNTMISRSKRKQKRTEISPDPKEVHDDERHAEIRRCSKREDEISQLIGLQRDQAVASESASCREWDARHEACTYCRPRNPV
jgi:hypothetical protein